MAQNFPLSVIVPVYNEEANIQPLLDKLLSVVSPYNYEILFVNDGSTDDTAQKIKQTIKNNNRIKLISFVRNFGHQMALTAGYYHARGDCVVTIDADLQDPPELIATMVKEWQTGSKIVYAKRQKREEGVFKNITAHLFYRLINLLSDTTIPTDTGDFRLLDREVVDFLNRLPEKSRFLRGLVSWGGFPATSIPFSRKARHAGHTHYPLSRMVSFALDGITSFSTKPLKIASYLGFLTSLLGFVGIIYAIYRRLFLPHEYWITGWTAIFVAIMFFGGVQLMTIGIIGEYIGKIYREVQGRPQYLVGEKVNV